MVVPPTDAPSRATRDLSEKISRLLVEHRRTNTRMSDAEVDQALRQSLRTLHAERSDVGVAPIVATVLGFVVALAVGLAVALRRRPEMGAMPDENFWGPVAAVVAVLAAIAVAVLKRARR